MRVPCPDVTKADFSAHEEYVTLYSVMHRRGVKVPDMLMSVFDVQSGRKLRTLQVRRFLWSCRAHSVAHF